MSGERWHEVTRTSSRSRVKISDHRSSDSCHWCLISLSFACSFDSATRKQVIASPQRKFTLETLLNPSSREKKKREKDAEPGHSHCSSDVAGEREEEKDASDSRKQLHRITRSNIDKDTWHKQKFLRYLKGSASFCFFDPAIDSLCREKERRRRRRL